LATKQHSLWGTVANVKRGCSLFQIVGAAVAKLREPKHVRTRQTDNKLESYERRAHTSWRTWSKKCNVA